MILKINYQSTIPIYQQIEAEIKSLINRGELNQGNTLPSIRKLAGQLDVSVNTVARAYHELERLGIIETGGRRGTFIKGKPEVRDELDNKVFKALIRDFMIKGVTRNEIRGIFESALDEIFS